MDKLESRKREMFQNLLDGKFLESNEVNTDPEELQYVQEQLKVLIDALNDTEGRDAAGVEPLKEYLNKIDEIRTMDDLRDFVLDVKGDNLTGISVLTVSAETLYTDPWNYYATMYPLFPNRLMLGSKTEYEAIDAEGSITKEYLNDGMMYLLTKSGYTSQEVRNTMNKMYRFESRLAAAIEKRLDALLKGKEDNFKNIWLP